MFADTRETETVFGPVIQAGLEALKVTVVAENTFYLCAFSIIYIIYFVTTVPTSISATMIISEIVLSHADSVPVRT